MLLAAFIAPTAAIAAPGGKDGKKHFSLGMKFEDAKQWDKAAEEFALAVSNDPKNPEYLLHYQRSLFNASQMYMKIGTTQANEKDYAGAYLSFRKAYAYDPVNELAKSEMERMVRLQQAVQNGENPETVAADGVKLVPTGYDNRKTGIDTDVPQKLEKLRDVPFPGGVDLQFLIRELAKDLDLNVLFDADTFRSPQKVYIELKNVSAAKALDYIFLQQSLFFQKVGPRTIIVANQNRRQIYQQLVLRTFYLANASPKDVAKVVQTAIPAQPGRTPTIPLIDEATNSITVRDTSENIKIIADLIKALDKDRPEVVMDVQIYEVSKQDLLQFGTQIGDSSSLVNLGGTNTATVGIGGSAGLPGVLKNVGVGLIVPPVSIQAFQKKQNSKLIASTQIHAFNNEDSSARIGQRVPVQTAQLLGYSNPGTTPQQQGNFNGNNAANVINYEQVGLTLKFKPIVFPNQDVQVEMEIESKDVLNPSLTPTFTERSVKGTARIQNNKTLLLASVAQGKQSDGRQGLPLLGLIPIIGRLFTAPTKDNSQTDIVIAITPRVIRAPAILPEDEIERPTGSLSQPTNGSLEALIIEEEREEQLALLRRTPKNTTTAQVNVQLPDQKVEDAPQYVKSNTNDTTAATTTGETKIENKETTASNLRPIDSGVKTLNIKPTVDDSSGDKIETKKTSLTDKTNSGEEPAANEETTTEIPKGNKPTAEIQFLPSAPVMKAGEKTKLAIMVKSATAFRSAVLGLKFDAGKVAVRSVSFGDVFGKEMANTAATPYINQNGSMYVSLSTAKDTAENSSGVIAYIEIEALADGKPEINFVADMMNVMTADGKNFALRF